MGQHRKEVNCSGCKGHKTIEKWNDGTCEHIPCPLCNGTGKQPSG